jgi:hypothetical protein
MNKTIVTITDPLEMAGFIKSNGTQCRFVSIVTNTPVVNLKPNSPFQGVRKVSRKMGIINANYNNSVRTRIAKSLGVKLSAEVKYKNGKVWYQHLKTVDGKSLPLVENKHTKNSKLYLQYFPHKATSAYVMPDGSIVMEQELSPWLTETSRSSYKPPVISVELRNIKEIRASGVIMQAEDIDEAEAQAQA